jgi:hypothetical protein
LNHTPVLGLFFFFFFFLAGGGAEIVLGFEFRGLYLLHRQTTT